jgi:hypothetical protein
VHPNKSFVQHFVGLYVCRRAFVREARRRQLSDVLTSGERGQTLLQLFQPWRLRQSAVSPQEESFTKITDLKKELPIAPSNLTRAIDNLVDDELVEMRPRSQKKEVRLSRSGFQYLKSAWDGYCALALEVVPADDPSTLESHYRVNHAISNQCTGRRSVVHPPKDPFDTVLSIFQTVQDLRSVLEQRVIQPLNLSLEQADLLVLLLLEWCDPLDSSNEEKGFVSLAVVRESLVHSLSPSPPLVSRWIGEMKGDERKKKPAFVEEKPLAGKQKAIRITQQGIDSITPVWNRYEKLADDFLGHLRPQDLDKHREVHEAIRYKLSPEWKRRKHELDAFYEELKRTKPHLFPKPGQI